MLSIDIASGAKIKWRANIVQIMVVKVGTIMEFIAISPLVSLSKVNIAITSIKSVPTIR